VVFCVGVRLGGYVVVWVFYCPQHTQPHPPPPPPTPNVISPSHGVKKISEDPSGKEIEGCQVQAKEKRSYIRRRSQLPLRKRGQKVTEATKREEIGKGQINQRKNGCREHVPRSDD